MLFRNKEKPPQRPAVNRRVHRGRDTVYMPLRGAQNFLEEMLRPWPFH